MSSSESPPQMRRPVHPYNRESDNTTGYFFLYIIRYQALTAALTTPAVRTVHCQATLLQQEEPADKCRPSRFLQSSISGCPESSPPECHMSRNTLSRWSFPSEISQAIPYIPQIISFIAPGLDKVTNPPQFQASFHSWFIAFFQYYYSRYGLYTSSGAASGYRILPRDT